MRKTRVTRIILWTFVIGFPLTVFQNCSGVLHFGNGGGYEGGKEEGSSIADKPVYTYQNHAPGTAACADGRPRNALLLTEANYFQAQIQREDCAENPALPEVAVITSAERPAPRVVIYKNKVYDLVPAGGITAKAEVFCKMESLTGSRQLLIDKVPAAIGATSYIGHVSIATNAGIASGDLALRLVQGTTDTFGGASFRGDDLAANSYLQVNIDPTYVASSIDYRLTINMPAGANSFDPIFGVYVGGGQFTNIVAPMVCFTPHGPQQASPATPPNTPPPLGSPAPAPVGKPTPPQVPGSVTSPSIPPDTALDAAANFRGATP